jgi:hypothetical protein
MSLSREKRFRKRNKKKQDKRRRGRRRRRSNTMIPREKFNSLSNKEEAAKLSS